MGHSKGDLSAFHDRIVAWRDAGLEWREMEDQLRFLGVTVQWNAVYRYAKKHGIPTGRLKEVQSASSGPPASREFEPELQFVTVPIGVSFGGFVSWVRPAVPPMANEGMSVAANTSEPKPESRAEPIGPAEQRPEPFPSEPLFTPLAPSSWDVNEPVLQFGDDDCWTLQDSFEGTLIVGATGSGKTSGSGRMIAEAFLSLGFGGLVLTAKDDERALWERYAAKTGRTAQLCIVRPGGPFKFNFLDYQTRLAADRGGSTENVVSLFHSVLEAFSRTKRTADSFWSNAAKQLLRNVVRVIRASGEPFNLRTIRHFISEMPRDVKEAESGLWKASPTFGRLIAAAKRNAGETLGVDLEEAFRYWTADFPALWHETRSTITADFGALVDLFFEPGIWQLFCQETTITPEATFDGAIIVIDLPIKKHNATGRLTQLFWKHLFQLAVERRNDATGAGRRPLFLWCDEAQQFVAETDIMFQATARSSRCATIYLTQTLPGFQAAMGGDQARERTDGLFANLTTKIVHANGDPATNEWAAAQIGRILQYRADVTTNGSQAPRRFGFREVFAQLTAQPQTSVSTKQVVDFEIQPSEFMKLRTGSQKNERLVDAYFLKPGTCFSNGKHYFKATFEQEAS